jgi:ABC-type cobalamin/Fe3+-siderophores transport system ATPase subunit
VAHIVEFKVTGLAGRAKPIRRKLDRHVNVFFGLNGSGKTSLLRILDAAMAGTVGTLRQVPFETAEVSIYSEKREMVFTRSIKKSALQTRTGEVVTADQLVYQVDIESQSQERSAWTTTPEVPHGGSGSFTHTFLPITRMYAPQVTSRSVLALRELHGRETASFVEQQLNEGYADSLQRLWNQYISTIQVKVRQAQAEGLANILRAVLSSREGEHKEEVDPAVAFSRISSFLRRQGSPQALPSARTFTSRYREDPRLRSVVADIDQVEREIEEAMSPRTKLQQLIARLFTGKEVRFGDRGIEVLTANEGTFDVGQLSSGEKQVLLLLIDVLRVGSNTLLIDEPELSMHVDWQQTLIRSMRELNPNAQLIMATHSPEVMADVADRHIFSI